MSFINQLKKAKSLKLELNGVMCVMPEAVLKIGRSVTFRSLGIDENETSYTTPLEKSCEKIFQTFANEYFSSTVPLENPSQGRAKDAVSTYKEIMVDYWTIKDQNGNILNGKESLAKMYQVEESSKEIEVNVIKSAVMKQADLFTTWKAMIPSETVRKSYKSPVPKSEIGLNFTKEMKKDKETMAVVIFNRYVHSVAALASMAFMKKIMSEDVDFLLKSLSEKLENKSLGEIDNSENRAQFFELIKKHLDGQLKSFSIAQAIAFSEFKVSEKSKTKQMTMEKAISKKVSKESPLTTARKNLKLTLTQIEELPKDSANAEALMSLMKTKESLEEEISRLSGKKIIEKAEKILSKPRQESLSEAFETTMKKPDYSAELAKKKKNKK